MFPVAQLKQIIADVLAKTFIFIFGVQHSQGLKKALQRSFEELQKPAQTRLRADTRGEL